MKKAVDVCSVAALGERQTYRAELGRGTARRWAEIAF